MKKGLTELVFIIDRSGSMGGFNAMLKEQQANSGDEARISELRNILK